jgi:hypothetical protein
MYFCIDQEIEAVLGNPVIADQIDRSYYSGTKAVAREMCRLQAAFPSLREYAPKLFIWDKELPETSFWWSTAAVRPYLHFLYELNIYFAHLLSPTLCFYRGMARDLVGQSIPQIHPIWWLAYMLCIGAHILTATVVLWLTGELVALLSIKLLNNGRRFFREAGLSYNHSLEWYPSASEDSDSE